MCSFSGHERKIVCSNRRILCLPAFLFTFLRPPSDQSDVFLPSVCRRSSAKVFVLDAGSHVMMSSLSLQVNVYTLGKTFLALSRDLCIKPPAIGTHPHFHTLSISIPRAENCVFVCKFHFGHFLHEKRERASLEWGRVPIPGTSFEGDRRSRELPNP